MSPHDDFTKCRRTMSTPNVIAHTQRSPLPVLNLTGRAKRMQWPVEASPSSPSRPAYGGIPGARLVKGYAHLISIDR